MTIMSRLVLIFVIVLACACASEQRLEDLDATLNLYQNKFRWSNFDELLQFRRQAKSLGLDDYKRLSVIRITSYEEKQRILTDDMSQAEQIVMIGYYDKESGTEHQLLDKQLWKYDEENQSWFLDSELPKFAP